ncbi:DoxX family protein [Paraflavitalea speifideaquila]|uniref:DoxX family protein n=1 Tax=Paraflavitalea speifideaquila TaxID=3076558 RepID=UPI0028EADAAC|nr:DoxX family protein [Paraflavitalea speifideiaquila]
MKTTNILYWIFTSLFGAFMLLSAIPDIFSHPVAVQGMHTELGYPLYFIPFIGVAKTLGVIAILLPGFPRIKEWAYAGLGFDLMGATYSIFAIGKPDWMYMLLFVAFFFVSYYLYHRRKKALAQAKGAPCTEAILVTSAMA